MIVSVEHLRLYTYVSFVLLVVTGMVLTKAFAHVDMQTTLLVRMYGYNNVCVWFDFPPATYVLPILWVVTLAFFLAFSFASSMRLQSDRHLASYSNGDDAHDGGTSTADGEGSPPVVRRLVLMKRFEAAMVILFSLIFAVKYDAPPGASASHERFLMILHTTPFFALQLGLISLALSSIVHGYLGGYWRRLGHLDGEYAYCFRSLMWPYAALLASIITFKICYCVWAWTRFPHLNASPALIALAHMADALFLLFALAIPMLKSFCLVWKYGEKLERLHVHLGTAQQHHSGKAGGPEML